VYLALYVGSIEVEEVAEQKSLGYVEPEVYIKLMSSRSGSSRLKPPPATVARRRRFRIFETLVLGLFVKRFEGYEQLIEALGGKAGEVVEVLGLAAEFLDGEHSSGSLPLSPQLRNGFS
jgi:hypothetical protein